MIVLYTNCQGQGLIKLLAQHGALAGCEFVHLRAWLHELPNPDQLARCRVLIYQTAWGAPAFLEQLSAATRTIAIPLLSCAALWPYAFDRPDEPAGWRFPYGDRNVAGKIKSGQSPQQAVSNYLKEDLAHTVRLDKLFELEQYKWHSNERDTPIRLADFISSRLFSDRLFFTPDHPTDVVLIELANQILALLGHPPFNRPHWPTYRHSLQGAEVPVHPSVLHHFAISWLSRDNLYALYGGWIHLNTHDYLVQYAMALLHPTYQTALQQALAALADGNTALALNISTLIRLKEPQHRAALAIQAVVSAAAGNHGQAAALLGQFPDLAEVIN